MTTPPLLKGSLQTILLKLLADHQHMYGYEITQKVKEITSGQLVLNQGALYPALHKLEAEGILETYTEIVDGRARKYYRLTASGKKDKDHKLQEAQEFIVQLQKLLNLKPAL